MKLWQKNTASLQQVEQFTVGNDRQMDVLLAPFDVQGNMAHAIMLQSIGLLTETELNKLLQELLKIYESIQNGNFEIANEIEDVHSQIEFLLTKALGDTGKKIHSARSRNDQVLVDIKLFLRHEITTLVEEINSFFVLLQKQSETFKSHLLPGYTHLQLAMPSSFGLWFGAYAEALVDDVQTLHAAYKVTNKNPLGSAAGYGSSFAINRTLTTKLLGFESLNFNVVYAQMGRGKTERIVAQALANVADTLAKLSMDMCLYLNQNFGFVSFPAELTTGSSIMPHKKNPDVFEIIRGRCNTLKALPNEIAMLTTNLPSGYHREMQLLKEHIFPAFGILKNCIQMARLMLENISIEPSILQQEKYKYLFTVNAVNNLVKEGIPFRDAYKIIGEQVENNSFAAPANNSIEQYTHEGSIGNLCNDEIKNAMQQVISEFDFDKVKNAIEILLKKAEQQ
jgi:argininosuccinate lyase